MDEASRTIMKMCEKRGNHPLLREQGRLHGADPEAEGPQVFLRKGAGQAVTLGRGRGEGRKRFK